MVTTGAIGEQPVLPVLDPARATGEAVADETAEFVIGHGRHGRSVPIARTYRDAMRRSESGIRERLAFIANLSENANVASRPESTRHIHVFISWPPQEETESIS